MGYAYPYLPVSERTRRLSLVNDDCFATLIEERVSIFSEPRITW